MNKHVVATDHLDFGPEGVPLDLPSLGVYLGYDAAPLTYEAGHRGDPLRLYCTDPDDLDMAAANGLSRWIQKVRAALRPWTLLNLEGAFTPPSGAPAEKTFRRDWAPALALSTLHASAYTLRWMLREEASALLMPTDQAILSILARPHGATGPALMVDITVEGEGIHSRLDRKQWTILNRRCLDCEAQLLPSFTEERRWFEASGVLRLDLAIGILREPVFAWTDVQASQEPSGAVAGMDSPTALKTAQTLAFRDIVKNGGQ